MNELATSEVEEFGSITCEGDRFRLLKVDVPFFDGAVSVSVSTEDEEYKYTMSREDVGVVYVHFYDLEPTSEILASEATLAIAAAEPLQFRAKVEKFTTPTLFNEALLDGKASVSFWVYTWKGDEPEDVDFAITLWKMGSFQEHREE